MPDADFDKKALSNVGIRLRKEQKNVKEESKAPPEDIYRIRAESKGVSWDFKRPRTSEGMYQLLALFSDKLVRQWQDDNHWRCMAKALLKLLPSEDKDRRDALEKKINEKKRKKDEKENKKNKKAKGEQEGCSGVARGQDSDSQVKEGHVASGDESKSSEGSDT